jgi:hypothetical protein
LKTIARYHVLFSRFVATEGHDQLRWFHSPADRTEELEPGCTDEGVALPNPTEGLRFFQNPLDINARSSYS